MKLLNKNLNQLIKIQGGLIPLKSIWEMAEISVGSLSFESGWPG